MGLLSASDAKLERLIISSHKLIDCTDDAMETFKVQVNPKELEYKFSFKTVGEDRDGRKEVNGNPGGAGSGADGYKSYNPKIVKFKFYADATGLLPIEEGMKDEFLIGTQPSISRHLEKLRQTLYCYKEKIRRPPYLKLAWGTIFPSSNTKDREESPAVFKAQLDECVVKITLFSLSGEPVKAEIDLTVESLIDPKEVPIGSSSDMTHAVEVTEGDQMTTHCNEMYGRSDSQICSAVAEYNDMIDWNLIGGTTIIFPSIRILEEQYLENYDSVEITPLDQETEEEQMIALVGAKRAQQYYNTFPSKTKHNKAFSA